TPSLRIGPLPSDHNFETDHAQQVKELLRLDGFLPILCVTDEAVPGSKYAGHHHLVHALLIPH
ncbi:MAG: hypothetical protein ACSLEZ_01270, partial [Thiobacillus sp.]